MKNITASVVVSTYNWPEALELCLLSIANQTVLPNEVVVGDDGSRDDTRQLIERMRPQLPYKLIHVWQEDKGFRLATICNRALARCTSDYVIKIDQDIIMDPHFVEDHVRHAERGYYISGSRAKLTEPFTKKILASKNYKLSPFTNGVIRKFNAMRIPWLTKFFYKYMLNKLDRGCNMSFWRDDLYAVNGYDGDMVGYGNEDIDLSARIRALGVKKRTIKFSCIEYHIYHPEASSKFDDNVWKRNRALREKNASDGIIKIKNGIDQFL